MLLTSTPNRILQEEEIEVTASISGAMTINIPSQSTNYGYSFLINGLKQSKPSYSTDNDLLSLPSGLNIIQGDTLTFIYFI